MRFGRRGGRITSTIDVSTNLIYSERPIILYGIIHGQHILCMISLISDSAVDSKGGDRWAAVQMTCMGRGSLTP